MFKGSYDYNDSKSDRVSIDRNYKNEPSRNGDFRS